MMAFPRGQPSPSAGQSLRAAGVTSVRGVLFAPTRQRGRIWRWWNRKRAWCVTTSPLAWDRRTAEQRRRGDEVLERQSRWRVLRTLQRKGRIGPDGCVPASKFLPAAAPRTNVIRLMSRATD